MVDKNEIGVEQVLNQLEIDFIDAYEKNRSSARIKSVITILIPKKLINFGQKFQ